MELLVLSMNLVGKGTGLGYFTPLVESVVANYRLIEG